MTLLFDLHVHTMASDGAETPAEVVARAKSIGLAGIAVTDHDTVAGLAEALEAAKKENLLVVPGVEISTEEGEREIHILGYFLDPTHPNLLATLRWLKEKRLERVVEMVRRLQNLGIPLTLEEVVAKVRVAAGRPHVARVLVEKGVVASIEEAFQRFLGRGCPAYVPRARFSPVEAVKVVHQAGGVPVLAHPGLNSAEELLPELIKAGLQGIEVEYPEHTPEQRAYYRELASSFGLIATGGSDYHGPHYRHPLGAAVVTEEVVLALRRAAGKSE
ncbi:PHP domain protein [Ammonifex degensii KC4]|uniref:PHP domain protein n=1 Tax=Ammonifex degensii (strain DSM 10501 / KC4) TaxID=429009 RepID=C9R8D8_AMMDK|nr:PHP domain-containing protein [Ammonifex degensii]ACX52567.1 PHP domain protein [Ammonifex degensii KC4]